MSNDLHTQKELVELERKLKENHNDSSFGKGLIICLIIDAIIAGLIIGFSFLSEEMNWDRDKFIILSDAFSLPGIYTILFFLISWVSGEGAFDAISYGVQVAFFTISHKDLRETKLPKTYADYRELKRHKKKGRTLFLLVAGGIFLLIGIIFSIFFTTTIK
jgi:zinc transporter ZupT